RLGRCQRQASGWWLPPRPGAALAATASAATAPAPCRPAEYRSSFIVFPLRDRRAIPTAPLRQPCTGSQPPPCLRMERGSYKPLTRRLRTFLLHPQPAHLGATSRLINNQATRQGIKRPG